MPKTPKARKMATAVSVDDEGWGVVPAKRRGERKAKEANPFLEAVRSLPSVRISDIKPVSGDYFMAIPGTSPQLYVTYGRGSSPDIRWRKAEADEASVFLSYEEKFCHVMGIPLPGKTEP